MNRGNTGSVSSEIGYLIPGGKAPFGALKIIVSVYADLVCNPTVSVVVPIPADLSVRRDNT
jgi:hypothetical protein